jgi:hypothetical protein
MACVVFALPSCGDVAPPTKAPPRETLLDVRELSGYVPAAGLRWLLMARPQSISRHPVLSQALVILFPTERLDGYAQATGVDLRSTPNALAAGFDYATLYMAETPHENSVVQEKFERRLLHHAHVRRPHPRLWWVSGVVGETPQTLVRIDEQLVAVSVGDPTPARTVEAFARGRLKESPAALEGAALSSLPESLHDAPLRFYAPGPFDEEWKRGAHGLLAGALALGASARPAPDGSIAVELVLSGDFWSEPHAETRLRSAWSDLAESTLGRLLGLHRPAREAAVRLERDRLELSVAVELKPLVNGLHAAVAADIWQIMGLENPVNRAAPEPVQ